MEFYEKVFYFFEKKDEKAILWYCPSGKLFVSSSHQPETSSRVTLALLGSVFQTKKDGNISHKIGQSLINLAFSISNF